MAEGTEIERPNEGKVLYPFSIAVLVAGLLLGFAVFPRLFVAHSARTGGDAPDFSIELVANGEPNQKTISLAELKGKPVLLDFWATWCGPCQAEAPIVNKLAQRYRDRGLVVLGINTSDEAGRAAPWAAARNISFPIAFDPSHVAALYGVDSLPTMVLVSREGKILAVRTGATSGTELEKLVQTALN